LYAPLQATLKLAARLFFCYLASLTRRQQPEQQGDTQPHSPTPSTEGCSCVYVVTALRIRGFSYDCAKCGLLRNLCLMADASKLLRICNGRPATTGFNQVA
jgi:hypothetical protein